MVSKDACVRCMVRVTGTNKGIQCDTCDRWFHSECIKMSASDYKRYANDENLKWLCNRTDCGSDSTSQLKFDPVIKALFDKMDSLATKADLTHISNDITYLRQEISSLTKQMSQVESRVTKLESEIKSLKSDMALNITEHMSSSTNDIYSEIVDRTARQSNVILHNIPESSSTQSNVIRTYDLDLLNKIFASLDFQVQNFTFFRLGKSCNKTHPIKVILPSPNDFGLSQI
ncbi:hypothetical protein J6590_082257 [Homalodisca vitripennis]|nr:hypothetical protein J6590_082257 [Homalodisca vitripennis]